MRPATWDIGASSGSEPSARRTQLIGHGGAAGFEEAVGKRAVGGKVEVGEEGAVRVEIGELAFDRLFDLHHERGRPPYLFGGGHDCGAGGRVGGVGVAGTNTGVGLDEDLVASVAQCKRAFRGEPDPVFAVFSFANRADAHLQPPRYRSHRTASTNLPPQIGAHIAN